MTELAWLDAWRSAGLGPRVVACGAGYLLSTVRGARAFPLDEHGQPLLWVAPALRPNASPTGRALADHEWNLGGERLWLAPEIRFMIHDRRNFDGSYELPIAMDPGDWSSDPDEPGRYRQTLELVARDTQEVVRLDVIQRLAPAGDPLRRKGRSNAVRHLGWTREVRLRRTTSDPELVACQAWVVTQVQAGGVAWVPGAAGARVSDYFEPIDGSYLGAVGSHLSLKADGERRYKVGVVSGEHRGQLLYWHESDDRAVLYLRRFLDLASGRYLEQPPELLDHEGDSVFVYNDDGKHGHFGELEVLGRTLEPNLRTVSDLFEMHVWWGVKDEVVEVAREWLGADWDPEGEA